ncbi:MAG TPA: PAS domain-containing protein, partial [Gammaproteobacteria bacterium]
MLSLVARFILYFAVSAFGVLAAITSLEYQKFDLEKSQSQLQESVRLLLTARALQSDLREPIRDISTIAALQVLSDYLRDETPANRVRVETVFQNFAQNAGVYDKIRYIDVAGMERVRVNYSGHVATAIPLAELEDKSGRYYFRETLHLTPNTIYISSLDLNVEDGQIEHPYKPMIRFAKAVSDSAGRLKGNVVLNYLGVILLDDFREFMADSWGEPMMVNREGYWLSSPDKVDEWGFLLGSNASFAKRYSEAWDYVTRHESGAVETKEGLFIFNTVHPYAVRTIRGATPAEESVAEQYWKIITRIPLQFLIYSPASVFEKRTNEITWLLLLVGILSAALAWLRTNYLSKVSALRESEKRLAEAEAIAHVGNWVWDIPMNKLSWSDTVYSIFGRHPRSFETSYGAFIAAIHPEDRDIVSDTVDAAMYKNKPYIIDHRIVLPDHTVRYVHERGAVQFDHTGQPVRMLGTIQDITESTQAAQALQASEARYHNLFENMVDGYALHEVVFDVKG